MLWQKDRNLDIYVDLLENVHYSQHNRLIHRKKSNTISLRLRMEGNQKYGEKNFDGAWIKYNESVCFAENGSDDLALAYANRSMCFLKLQLFDCCLLDIQLAKDAGYPNHLMVKFEDRKRECMRRQTSIQVKSINPTLSFEPDHKLPSMASVLQIEINPFYDRLVKAKCDIKIGETVLIEEEYIRTVDCDVNNFCTNCGKKVSNFIPCKNCADATFCSVECTTNNNFHEIECDMMLGTDDICDGESLTFILRSLVIGINNFPTIDEMTKILENWRSTDPHEITESCETPQWKYRTFFKLASHAQRQRIVNFRRIAYFILHSIMSSSKIAKKFETMAAKRFLIHLIFHHGMVLATNSFSFENDEVHIHKLALITSYINHSCLPNVAKLSKGNLSICKTILPVKRGEQLFLTYIQGDAFDMTAEQRNDFLESTYGFRCQCNLCTQGRLPAGDLDTDPSFMYVSSNVLDDSFVEANIAIIIKHCITFIVKHPKMIGSKEINYIANILSVMFSKELNNV